MATTDADPAARPAGPAARLAALAVTLWVAVDAVLAEAPAWPGGLSTFGYPPWLDGAWVLAGLAAARVLWLAPDRQVLARRLTLVLAVATILGLRAVPADPGAGLILAGLTLALALPWLRPTTTARATVLALALAVPALVGSVYPHGGLHWLQLVLPPAALGLLVPALFAGRTAGLAALLVGASATLAAAALLTYPAVASGLHLPLGAVLSSRLPFLGLHPNLSVPHLVAMVLLGAAWWSRSRGGARRWALLATLLALVALAALRSRTGFLALAGGGALLVAAHLRAPWAPWIRRLAAALVLALLVLPATGLTDPTLTDRTADTVRKAVSFRSHMWQLGRDTFAAAPWHGFGPGTTYIQGQFARPSRYNGLPTDDHPHSVVLAAGQALGWPGLLGLALLLAATLLRPPRLREAARGAPGPDGLGPEGLRPEAHLAAGCDAALLALWAANAVDMGGAADTLFPSLVFLLLGMREAAGLGAAPAPGDERSAGAAEHGSERPSDRSWSLGAAGLACGCLLLGPVAYVQRATLATAARKLEQLEPMPVGLERQRAGEAVGRQLEHAASLLPTNPAPWLLRARLALALADEQGAQAALEEARERVPDAAGLAFQLAAVVSRRDPGDPRALALLRQAVALDPHGPEAPRRRLALGRALARRGEAAQAAEALLEALLTRPDLAAQIPRQGAGEALAFAPAGPGHATVPWRTLREAIERRREALRDADPARFVRLLMREIDILEALGELERADRAAERLLAAYPTYLAQRRANLALDQGRAAEALATWEAAGSGEQFWLLVQQLRARAQVEPLDAEAFARTEARALARLPDVVFDAPAVRALLQARERFATRQGDAVGMNLAQLGLTYLDR